MSKQQLLLIILGIGLGTAHAVSIKTPQIKQRDCSQARIHKTESFYTRSLMVIVDSESFMCTPCLEPILDLNQCFPLKCQGKRVLGIIVLRERGKEADRDEQRRILEKKLRGFIKANQIKFPILVDHMCIFREMVSSGPCVVLLDPMSRSLSMYMFPLNSRDKEKIVKFFKTP